MVALELDEHDVFWTRAEAVQRWALVTELVVEAFVEAVIPRFAEVIKAG